MILVTGAKGFIGSNLAAHIPSSDLIKWDLEEGKRHSIEDIAQTVELIIHLGAISSTQEEDTSKLAELNILASTELLEYAVKNDIAFIYASSASVYGSGASGFCEDKPLEPLNYYAISKAAFDMFAAQKMKDHPDAKIFGLRFFNVYGRGEHNKGPMASPIHKFVNQARSSNEIKIFEGSENYVRDFISVDDVVSIILASKDFQKSGIYNVGTGISRSFLDVAKIISSHTGAKIVEIPFPPHLVDKYQAFTRSDNTKLLDAQGHSFLTLEEGIAKYIGGMAKE